MNQINLKWSLAPNNFQIIKNQIKNNQEKITRIPNNEENINKLFEK